MNLNIRESLREVGVSSKDVIIIHANAGVAAQLIHVDLENRLNTLINDLVNFIGNSGTLVIPTFSYTFTKNQEFDFENTPSDIGTFSESCRIRPEFCRSRNPNFSFSSVGKYAKYFADSRIDDCFGNGTAFDLLFKYNAKIVCLGCDFSRITFAHYVEQSIGVPYRYLKSFKGYLVNGQTKESIDNTYYVRDLSIDSQGELSLLERQSKIKGVLKSGKFGRYPILSMSTHDFYSVSKELIEENPYALTAHRLKK